MIGFLIVPAIIKSQLLKRCRHLREGRRRCGKSHSKIHITDDGLLELMKAHAQAIQAALMESGKVPADHVFVVAPKKPMNGQARANFTLE
ncbi:MAG TPA: hypothetical protein VGN61_06910 [Verrucomicrobiae bacterium]